MKRLFVSLYIKLILAAGVALLLTWVGVSQINKHREMSYWQKQMSGFSYLIEQGASRHEGEARLTWLSLAFKISGLSFNVVPNQSNQNVKYKIERTKTQGQFIASIPLDENIVQFDFSNISKQFMEGVNKLTTNEIRLHTFTDRENFVDILSKQFSYPVQVIDSQSLELSEFEKRQLSSRLVLYRFDEGISAISSYGRLDKLLKIGPVKTFNPYPNSLLIVSCFFLLLFTFVISLFLIRPIEKRFLIFSSQVDKIKLNQKNIFSTVNIKQEGNDELSKLSEKVDDMAKKIIQFAQDQQQMTRSVSHEIRTPLVKMNYRLARIESDNMSQAQQKNIQGLKNNMSELDQLINELLLYSSLDSLPSPELIEFDVNEFLQEKIKALQDLSKANIVLINANTQVMVTSFPNYLTRIMQNLLTNAQRYATENIYVSASVLDGIFTLIVEDDGPGISKELATKIFEPFVVDDESRNSALNGHGLGLSIVSKMVELLNGEVEIQTSEQLNGAKFVLAFKC